MFKQILQQKHQAWLRKSPAEQFLLWVITYPIWPLFTWLLTFAMIAMQQNGRDIPLSAFAWVWVGCCVGFVLHVFAHLYLTIIWPHFYQHPDSAPPNSFTGKVLGWFKGRP